MSDTEALVQTVRSCMGTLQPSRELAKQADAALDSLAAELERLRSEKALLLEEGETILAQLRADQAELERVKAERDEALKAFSAYKYHADRYEALLDERVAERDEWRGDALASTEKLDKALSALVWIRDTGVYENASVLRSLIQERCDAAIAEIEGETA